MQETSCIFLRNVLNYLRNVPDTVGQNGACRLFSDRKVTIMNLVLGIILLIAAVFLVLAVVAQQGKAHGLSGAIAGGAETFFGKNKSRGLDGKLQKITKIAAVVFIVLAIVTTIVVAHNASSSAAVTDVNAAVQEILNDVAESETAETETAAEGETAADAEPADAEPAADAEAEADTAAN